MTTITCSELKQKIANNPSTIVIDVREPWEYDEQNIGAKNIPLAEIPSRLDELKQLKQDEIIVHCKSGSRSNQAMKYLTQHGFQDVKSLEGGIEAYLTH